MTLSQYMNRLMQLLKEYDDKNSSKNSKQFIFNEWTPEEEKKLLKLLKKQKQKINYNEIIK